MCSRHAAEIFPLLRFYQILSLKNKRKFFIEGLSKQYGFASQGFLVVRGNGWDFYGVTGTPAAGRGWGCVMLVSEHKYWQPCWLSLKYIHMK